MLYNISMNAFLDIWKYSERDQVQNTQFKTFDG